MTSTETTLLTIYGVIVAVWPIRHVVLRLILRKAIILTPASPALAKSDAPLVSAVIPAKDEEATILECLNSVCRQDYPRLEIIVADDRSSDRTGSIARALAECDPRLYVFRNEQLPEGWTGKTHVLHQAAGQARGDWFWFLDADTFHAPEFLRVLMEYARTERAAMVSLLPELRCETFWEHLVQPLAAIVLMQSFPLHRVNDDRSKLAFANGQSILIERTAYEGAGGHAAVRDRFVEDIGLASKVKTHGQPIRTVLVRNLVTCRMYASLGQLIRGWSRILYDALDRKTWRLALRLLDPLIFCQSGHIALLAAAILLLSGSASPFAWCLLGLSLVHHVAMYAVFRLVYQASVPESRFAALFPLGNVLVDLILLRAMKMTVTGRVTWRGTSYGIKVSEP
jgi:cellulose synthase/poly-beta-1,6-N-acetylglucosamine synthase-like glycosyltransferase